MLLVESINTPWRPSSVAAPCQRNFSHLSSQDKCNRFETEKRHLTPLLIETKEKVRRESLRFCRFRRNSIGQTSTRTITSKNSEKGAEEVVRQILYYEKSLSPAAASSSPSSCSGGRKILIFNLLRLNFVDDDCYSGVCTQELLHWLTLPSHSHERKERSQ